jgi:prepilin peptidase CpaA
MPSFFPNPAFGWTFYGVLTAFLVVAAYTDLRAIRIPKWLTLGLLGLGIAFNVARGIWMGSVLPADAEHPVWQFAKDSPALGALDGLLFSLAGFAVGLALFFLFWLLGMAGGGDVKLIAALGAWVGWKWVLALLLVSLCVLVLLTVFSLVRRLLRRGPQKVIFGSRRPGVGATKKMPAGTRRRDQLIAYSLPVAIATALWLPWHCHEDLHLHLPALPPAAPAPAE